MRSGRVVRDGSAGDVWAEPQTEFVARFLGHDNVLDRSQAAALGVGNGRRAVVVREAAIALVAPEDADRTGLLEATVAEVRFRGATSRVVVHVEATGGGLVPLTVHTGRPPALGERLAVRLDATQVSELDDE